MELIVSGLVWYAVFVFSTTCHEAAHALAAKRGGDLTAYAGGQVSLDPRPHMKREPMGMIVVPLASFLLGGWVIGWASTPFDPQWARRHPRRAALMSAAGPATNLTLALVAALTIRFGVLAGTFSAPGQLGPSHVAAGGGPMSEAAAFLLSVLFSLNLLLFIFNVLPLPPMDGWGIIPLFLSDVGTHSYQRLAAQAQGLSIVSLVIAWQVFPYLFQPVFWFAVTLIHPGVHYH